MLRWELQAAIKAGVTTINIIIIALALLPLKSLIDDLKAGVKNYIRLRAELTLKFPGRRVFQDA